LTDIRKFINTMVDGGRGAEDQTTRIIWGKQGSEKRETQTVNSDPRHAVRATGWNRRASPERRDFCWGGGLSNWGKATAETSRGKGGSKKQRKEMKRCNNFQTAKEKFPEKKRKLKSTGDGRVKI